MKRLMMFAVVSVFLFTSVWAFAGDVWVDPYYRSNGTYVRGHYRSAPDGQKWNNYGPSTSYTDRYSPYTRDWDGDGSPNYLDRDDDNDGVTDNYDGNQYRR